MSGLCALALALQLAASQPVAAAADSTAPAVEYFQPAGPLARVHLEPYGDLRLWIERVENRPGATEALERARATARSGLRWRPPESPLEARAGVRASLGSDTNAESRAAFDNEIADTVEVDELALRLEDASGDAATLGKIRSPLGLTEMMWDGDLRPVGLAFGVALGRVGLPRVVIAGGTFTRSRFSANDAWMGVGQLAIHWEPGPGRRGEAVLSYLEPWNLDSLPRQGFARQNATVLGPDGRVYAQRFRTLDLQLAATLRWGPVPIAMRVEGARNLAVSTEGQAARTRLALGGTEVHGGLELGWVYQRIEREAVCGAFNSDDWWFHSRVRGNLVWGAVGVGRPLSFRASTFIERRDDLTQDVHRFRAELTAVLPAP